MSTQFPTTFNQRRDAVDSTLLMVGLLIGALCVGLLVMMFLFRAHSASRVFLLEREMLIKEGQALQARQQGTNPPGQDEINAYQKKVEAFQCRNRGILVGTGMEFTRRVTGSTDAALLSDLVFHTGTGRILAIAFQDSTSQISWLLGWLLTKFIGEYVTTQLIELAPNIMHAYATAIGVTFLVWFLFRIVTTSANQYIQRNMGSNSIFYDNTTDRLMRDGFNPNKVN